MSRLPRVKSARHGAPSGCHVITAPAAAPDPTVADLVDCLRDAGPLDERYLKEVERGIAFLNEPAIPPSRWES